MNDMKETMQFFREHHRMREDLLRARVKLGQQVSAICWRLFEGLSKAPRKVAANKLANQLQRLRNPSFEKVQEKMAGAVCGAEGLAMASLTVAPLLRSQAPLKEELEIVEKKLCDAARELPIWPWAEGILGLGELAVAMLIGEIGNPAEYPTVAGVWKRMGVGVMPGGIRQRLVANNPAAAEANGYNPRRRAVLFRVGHALFLAKKKNKYGAKYDRERARMDLLHPDWTKNHRYLAAHRLMEKAFLRDFVRQWVAAVSP